MPISTFLALACFPARWKAAKISGSYKQEGQSKWLCGSCLPQGVAQPVRTRHRLVCNSVSQKVEKGNGPFPQVNSQV